MVENFLSLIDKLTELVVAKKIAREDTFNNVIDPLFLELAPVVDDYFSMFRQARDLVTEGQKNDLDADDVTWNGRGDSIEAVQALLRKRREEYLSARIAIRTKVEAIGAHTDDENLKSFVSAVSDFFFSSEVKEYNSKGARLVEVLDACQKNTMPINNTIEWIDSVLSQIESNWARIVYTYTEIRVKYLRPNLSLPKNDSNRWLKLY